MTRPSGVLRAPAGRRCHTFGAESGRFRDDFRTSLLVGGSGGHPYPGREQKSVGAAQ
jgi:hypothetical protein